MGIWKQHENEQGESTVDQDTFRDILHSVLGEALSDEQLNLMFMRVNANSGGTLSWDDFSSYMMSRSADSALTSVLDGKLRTLQRTLHQEAIIYIDYIPRERRYLTVGRDGLVSLWSPDFLLQRVMDTKEFNPGDSWINDAKVLNEHNKLACVLDDRRWGGGGLLVGSALAWLPAAEGF